MGKIILLNDTYRYELPPEPQMERDILFAGDKKSDQYWRREGLSYTGNGLPPDWKDWSVRRRGEFIEREVERSFITGVWFANGGELVWLPPDMYHYLTWFKMKDGKWANFRYAQLHEYYFENYAEAQPRCIGTFRFKKRRDGLTTRRMQRMVWKAIQPRYANSWLGLQSKTGPDARDVCWETLMTGYKSMPSFFKPEQSGSSDPKKKLELRRPAQRLTRTNVNSFLEEEEEEGLNTIIDYRDTTVDAYDGQELLDLSLDEGAKWEKASILRAFATYTKCVWKDGVKVGHIHIFSSPAQKNGRPHNESVQLWEMGDPARAEKTASWFILRYFTGALEGYGGACDKFGRCDRDLAARMIREEIDNAPLDLRSELRRQLPTSIDEVLLGTDDMVFGAAAEMKERKIFLMGATHKDEARTTPKNVYGNLEWKAGQLDSEVQFRPSREQGKYSASGKFCFSFQPHGDRCNLVERKHRLQRDTYHPPLDCENVVGIDPYDYRKVVNQKTASQGAAICGAALDFFSAGIKNRMWCSYLWRPKMPEDFYEDMIKLCVYLGAVANVEARNKNIFDYFEDRGYEAFLLPKDILKKNSEQKGNATTTSLIDEMCSLLDQYYNDPDVIENTWDENVLGDNLLFNPDDTQTAHLTMAQGQMLLGFQKLRLLKRRRRTPVAGVQNEIAQSLNDLYF